MQYEQHFEKPLMKVKYSDLSQCNGLPLRQAGAAQTADSILYTLYNILKFEKNALKHTELMHYILLTSY